MNEFPMTGIPVIASLAMLAALTSLVWHIAVIVFVYRIWQKVKHLPG